MEQILAKLSPKDRILPDRSAVNDSILSKLSEQQVLLEKQQQMLFSNGTATSTGEEDNSSAASAPLTPATKTLPTSSSSGDNNPNGNKLGTVEMLRLKQELIAANSRIALQEQELAQTRVIKHTIDQAMGPPSEADFGGRDVTEQTISSLQNAFNASTRPFNQRQETWMPQDDARSDISDALSAGAYNRARGIWTNSSQPAAFGMNMNGGMEKNYRDPPVFPNNAGPPDSGRNWNNRPFNPGFPAQGGFAHSQRVLSGPSHPAYPVDGRYAGDQAPYMQANGPRRSITQVNRGGSCFPPQNSPWGTFSPEPTGIPPRTAGAPHMGAYQQVGVFPSAAPYHPRPIGTPLSPTAAEFTSTNSSVSSWGSPVSLYPPSPVRNRPVLTFLGRYEPVADLCVSPRADELSSPP